MKIGVAATGGSLDAEVSPQFGRCPWFVVVDVDSLRFEAFQNASGSAAGGAGPAAVKEVVARGAELVLAGRFGPNAQQALEAAGVRYAEASGKVRAAVTRFSKSSA